MVLVAKHQWNIEVDTAWKETAMCSVIMVTVDGLHGNIRSVFHLQPDSSIGRTGRWTQMHMTRSTAQQHLTSPHSRWSRIGFDPDHNDTFVSCASRSTEERISKVSETSLEKGTSLMHFRWLHVERTIDVSVLSSPDFGQLDSFLQDF